MQCGEILRQLMERDLVRIAGRSEDLGRPFFYGTTRQFLQVFGLRHLDELPRSELLRGAPSSAGREAAQNERAPGEDSSQPVYSHETEGESTVKTLARMNNVLEDVQTRTAAAAIENELPQCDGSVRAVEDDEDFEDDEDLDDDEDLEGDEDLDEEDEDSGGRRVGGGRGRRRGH